jgi:hypothetical protein
MKRARFSEEQIITILKEAEGGAKSPSCVGGTESRAPRSILGGASTAVWKCRRCAGCVSSRKRTGG